LITAGQVLADRFEIRRRRGSGGMGEVFEAYDRDHDEIVALKTLARADGDTLARFKREFRALQRTSHPNLVSLRELIRDGERWFFTMELVDGCHFLEHVRGRAATGGPLRCDQGRLRSALGQLVAGVVAIHDAGLVHRDVKPSNVMVAAGGRVVLLDFGLVTGLDPGGQSAATGPIGTVEYMAPEQAAGRIVGAAADWYAVGVMLYEALTGRVPHAGHILEVLMGKQQEPPPPPESLAPDAPPDLLALCRDLLEIDPAARPGGAEVAGRLGLTIASERESRPSAPSISGVFVGRAGELAALAAAAELAVDRPIVHLVVGESGIGKSELVARFTRDLDGGALTLAGRCYERESVPYKALDGVADDLVRHLARFGAAEVAALLPARPALLVGLFPGFQRIEAFASARAARDEVKEPHELRRLSFGALREVLAGLAAAGRIVITIDDLQWADADSFLLLRELLRGDDAPAVLILATVRGGAGEADEIAARLDGITVERTTLGPLSEGESRQLAERLAVGTAGHLDLARIAREAGGHPLFLQEIVRHVQLQGEAAPSATLEEVLRARVAILDERARLVLEVVCLAGAPLPVDVVRQACRVSATEVTRLAATLRVAGLAREVHRGRLLALEPYHDRVRESVAARVDVAVERDLHARIAAALEASGEPRDPQLLLRNFLLAGQPDRAARYAEEAAERSEAARAFDQAADLWQIALDAVPRDRADARRVQLRLGQALINAGRGALAADQFLAAADGADRATRLECHRHAAEQLIISGRIAPGLEALDALLVEIGVPTTRTPRRTLLSLLRHRAALRLRGLDFRERERREIADAELLELDVLKAAAHSLALVDSLRGADFQVRQLRLALRAGYRPHIVRALLLESMYQSNSGNRRRAHRLIDRAVEIGIDPDDAYITAMLEGARGVGAYFTGDVVSAIPALARSEVHLRRAPGNNWEAATARLFQLFGLRLVGDFVAMRERYQRYSTEAAHRGDRYLDSTMRRAAVPMWLADDAPNVAIRELARATWAPDTDGFHVQHFHELGALGELALYTGDFGDVARIDDMSKRLTQSLLLRVETVRVQFHYLRGRLALAGHGRPADAARAARRLARDRNLLGPAWAMLLRAGLAAGRDRPRAITLLDQAATASDALGLRATAAAARLRLAELRAGPDDDTLAGTATAALIALGVRAPDRMARLLIPFGPPGRGP
jgi:eukaryotic-like serine/threonine-protein kinase